MSEPATSPPDWRVEGLAPLIWVVDDFNSALSLAQRDGTGLFAAQGLGRFRRLVEQTDAAVSINFVIKPEYAQAGIEGLKDCEAPMTDPGMRHYHDELQAWLDELGDRAEVTVHGWTHRMVGYSAEVEINPGGWEYTRRSEWLNHPDPVSNYRRCVNTLADLGYRVTTHVFSNCGGRMDKGTLARLRASEFGVLAKFPTQAESCAADYPEVDEMPAYLSDVDAFVFPWSASAGSTLEDLEELLAADGPIFLVNHGYEFFDPWFQRTASAPALRRLVADHAGELAFVRYGDYARLMRDRFDL